MYPAYLLRDSHAYPTSSSFCGAMDHVASETAAAAELAAVPAAAMADPRRPKNNISCYPHSLGDATAHIKTTAATATTVAAAAATSTTTSTTTSEETCSAAAARAIVRPQVDMTTESVMNYAGALSSAASATASSVATSSSSMAAAAAAQFYQQQAAASAALATLDPTSSHHHQPLALGNVDTPRYPWMSITGKCYYFHTMLSSLSSLLLMEAARMQERLLPYYFPAAAVFTAEAF
jgi:hypothetical protein